MGHASVGGGGQFGMIYHAFQAHNDVIRPLRAAAWVTSTALGKPWPVESLLLRNIAAGTELLARLKVTHRRPPFGIRGVPVGGQELSVREEAADVTPFGTLLRFAKDTAANQPKVLLVAPMSGH